jgi:hypothetical protein
MSRNLGKNKVKVHERSCAAVNDDCNCWCVKDKKAREMTRLGTVRLEGGRFVKSGAVEIFSQARPDVKLYRAPQGNRFAAPKVSYGRRVEA